MKIPSLILIIVLSLNCTHIADNKSESVPYDQGIGFITLKNTVPVNIYSDFNLTDLKDRLIRDAYVFNFLEKSEEDIIKYSNFEYGYEKFGLPIIDFSDERIKVLLPSKGEQYEYGFIKNDTTHINMTLWKDILPTVPLYFNEASDRKIFDWIDGNKIDYNLDDPKNYVLWPQEVNGDWMYVKFITPSDQCEQRVKGEVINGWIKYLTTDGRPYVWYFPRGC